MPKNIIILISVDNYLYLDIIEPVDEYENQYQKGIFC